MRLLKKTAHQIAFFVLCLIGLTHGAKILMLPMFHTSHVNFFVVAGDALREDGHDVTILSHPRNKKVMNKQGIKYLFTENKENVMDTAQFQSGFFQSDWAKLFPIITKAMPDYCESILGNVKLMAELTREKFDMVIIEGEVVLMCISIVPYKLGVPYIIIGAAPIDPWTVRVPSMPSVEPMPTSMQTNNMNFFERLRNFVTYVALHTAAPLMTSYNQDYLVAKYVPDKPQLSVLQLYKRAQLWLINWEPSILDYPRVSTPYYHFIGGIGATPAKPLPEEIESFIQTNKDGCIILTFGSALRSIPVPYMEKLFKAFEQIPLNILVKNDGETPQNVPKNVRVFKWLPQNDILGHPMLKLFITHGGNNGQQEALYHGVPQIVIPVVGDQLYSALRVKLKGIGLSADIHDFTVEELVGKIKEVAFSDKYRNNAKKASAIFRSLPDPKSKLKFWVNHVLEYGGDHLRPSYIDMPYYQFFMLDVLAFIIVIVMILLYAVIRCCRCCCRLCKKSTKEKTA